jgi:hypothetical protein
MIDNIKPGDNVFLVTGWACLPFLPRGETDGPLGIASLARAIRIGLGAFPIIVVGSKDMDPVCKTINAASMAHIYIGKCQKCDRTICLDSIKSMSPQLVRDLNLHLTLNGVHMLGGSMWVSAVHSEQDIDQTIDAFGAAFDSMLAEGIIKAK